MRYESDNVESVIGMTLATLIMACIMPHTINNLIIEGHKNCNLHCKYKRQIVKGELET